MSREVELGWASWTSFASSCPSCSSTAVQQTLSWRFCPAQQLKKQLLSAQVAGQWRGDTTLTLPLFWRRSMVSPVFFRQFLWSSLSLSRPLPTLSPSLIGHLTSVDVKQHERQHKLQQTYTCTPTHKHSERESKGQLEEERFQRWEISLKLVKKSTLRFLLLRAGGTKSWSLQRPPVMPVFLRDSAHPVNHECHIGVKHHSANHMSKSDSFVMMHITLCGKRWTRDMGICKADILAVGKAISDLLTDLEEGIVDGVWFLYPQYPSERFQGLKTKNQHIHNTPSIFHAWRKQTYINKDIIVVIII